MLTHRGNKKEIPLPMNVSWFKIVFHFFATS